MDENSNLSDLPLISFQGEINLICNNQELIQVQKDLDSTKQFGFDTETRPSFKKGEVYKVALLQLATENKAYLMRLHGITNFQPIIEIFENKEVLKVGVAIRDDLIGLQKLFKFTPQNFIELQSLAKQKSLDNFGLRGMAEEVLKARITKGPKTTNWEARELTDRQLLYAATDAWIGLKLFKKLSDTSTV